MKAPRWWVASTAGCKLLLAGFVAGKGGRPARSPPPDTTYFPARPSPTKLSLLREVGASLRGERGEPDRGVGSPHASAPVLAAYSYCEAVTGQQARNFAYGIRLLPAAKRQAMSALYAFSRRVDDIGDGALAPRRQTGRGWRRPGRCSPGSGTAPSTRTTPTRSPSPSPTPRAASRSRSTASTNSSTAS